MPTARYRFADTYEEFVQAVEEIGIPCVVKPIMSSSGHGQTTIKNDPSQPSLQREGDSEIHSPFVGGDGGGPIDRAWAESQKGGRAGAGRVIVEGFVDFDYEITLLTVRCAPSDKGLRTQDENSSDVENVETKVISPSSFILHPSS